MKGKDVVRMSNSNGPCETCLWPKKDMSIRVVQAMRDKHPDGINMCRECVIRAHEDAKEKVAEKKALHKQMELDWVADSTTCPKCLSSELTADKDIEWAGPEPWAITVCNNCNLVIKDILTVVSTTFEEG